MLLKNASQVPPGLPSQIKGNQVIYFFTFLSFDKKSDPTEIRWACYYDKIHCNWMNGSLGDFTHQYPSDFLALVINHSGDRRAIRIKDGEFNIAPDNGFLVGVDTSPLFTYKSWDGIVYEARLQDFLGLPE